MLLHHLVFRQVPTTAHFRTYLGPFLVTASVCEFSKKVWTHTRHTRQETPYTGRQPNFNDILMVQRLSQMFMTKKKTKVTLNTKILIFLQIQRQSIKQKSKINMYRIWTGNKKAKNNYQMVKHKGFIISFYIHGVISLHYHLPGKFTTGESIIITVLQLRYIYQHSSRVIS